LAFVYSAKRTQLLRCSGKLLKPIRPVNLKRLLLGTAVASTLLTLAHSQPPTRPGANPSRGADSMMGEAM